MPYWLVSLPQPEGETPEGVWSQLQDLTTYRSDLSVNFRFHVPEFRVGTLDSLLALSDELVKVNGAVEGTVNKARRTLFDLSAAAPEGAEAAEVLVEGESPEGYLQSFAWQEAKYPSRRPLKDTLAAISDTVGKLDDDLKQKSSEYSGKRSALLAILRKATGALPVRDLTELVPPSRRVESEHLVTVAVVAPKPAKRDLLASYETLTDYVVPRSAFEIAEDNEHVAVAVVLFRRILDDYKAAARSKGFTVRDLTPLPEEPAPNGASAVNGSAAPPPPAAALTGTAAKAAAEAELESLRSALEEWALAAHAEAFSAWIHVLAVRAFVESVLRYGLPPQFVSALLRPQPKTAQRLRKVLADAYAGVGSRFYGAGDASLPGGGGDADAFPYVSFTLSIEEGHH